MRALAVLLALSASLPAGPAPIPADSGPPAPTRLVVSDPGLSALPAGDELRREVPVHRAAGNGSAPGPGRVELALDAPEAAGCRPERQTVRLDPATGRGTGRLTCQPTRPGAWTVSLRARSATDRPGRWTGRLTVRPDALSGSLAVGPPQGYRLPLELALAPEHLDSAPVNVTALADLEDSPLGFRHEAGTLAADGSPHSIRTVARHGPGTYHLVVNATGPRTRNWTAEATVEVPPPPEPGRLELNATVAPGRPSVRLASDAVNDDGKTKAPGRDLITRLEAEHADRVNVTVLRSTDDERIPLASAQPAVPPDGRIEHVFAHDPLPAGRLWVQATAGNSSVARTAHVRDLEASAQARGPETLLADGRPWQGELVLADPNFGSTPQDPGPVFGLPDVTWRVFHGTATAPDFRVRLGPFAGPSEGEAATSRIPWPQGEEGVQVRPGRARLPLEIRPPEDVDPGSYRLSVYAPDGDRIGGPGLRLEAPPSVQLSLPDPEPGARLPVRVNLTDPVPDTVTNLTLSVDGDPVARGTVTGNGSWAPRLPAPLAAGANATVEARARWPGRPPADELDALARRPVADLPPNVTAHAAVDGRPARAPLDLHPAGAHVIELVPRALDPNTGPVDVDARLEGPGGPPNWTLEREDGLVRVLVPEDARVGRYAVNLTAETADGTGRARVPVNLAPTLRLAVEGPDAVELREDASRSFDVTVANRGSLPVEAVTAVLDAEIDVRARLSNGTDTVPTGRPLGLPLAPGERGNVTVTLAPEKPGQGRVALTVAGVVP